MTQIKQNFLTNVSDLKLDVAATPLTGGERFDRILEGALQRRKLKWKIQAAVLKASLFCLLLLAFFALDVPIVRFTACRIQPLLDTPLASWFLVSLQESGSWLGLTLIAMFFGLVSRGNYRRVAAVLILVIVSNGVTEVGKALVRRERPRKVIAREARGEFSAPEHRDRQSFPSGHATAAFSLYASVGRFYPRASLFLLILAYACAFARVCTLHHYPSDVFAGALIGYYVSKWLLQAYFFQWASEGRTSTATPSRAGGNKCL